MLFQSAKLPDDLFTFGVFRQSYIARYISQIERDIPIEAGCGFRLPKCVGQTLSAVSKFLVPGNMCVGKYPNSECFRWPTDRFRVLSGPPQPRDARGRRGYSQRSKRAKETAPGMIIWAHLVAPCIRAIRRAIPCILPSHDHTPEKSVSITTPVAYLQLWTAVYLPSGAHRKVAGGLSATLTLPDYGRVARHPACCPVPYRMRVFESVRR